MLVVIFHYFIIPIPVSRRKGITFFVLIPSSYFNDIRIQSNEKISFYMSKNNLVKR
jgi:hypothetical protein